MYIPLFVGYGTYGQLDWFAEHISRWGTGIVRISVLASSTAYYPIVIEDDRVDLGWRDLVRNWGACLDCSVRPIRSLFWALYPGQARVFVTHVVPLRAAIINNMYSFLLPIVELNYTKLLNHGRETRPLLYLVKMGRGLAYIFHEE